MTYEKLHVCIQGDIEYMVDVVAVVVVAVVVVEYPIPYLF